MTHKYKKLVRIDDESSVRHLTKSLCVCLLQTEALLKRQGKPHALSINSAYRLFRLCERLGLNPTEIMKQE